MERRWMTGVVMGRLVSWWLGDMEMGRLGELEIGRHGDLEIRGEGDGFSNGMK